MTRADLTAAFEAGMSDGEMAGKFCMSLSGIKCARIRFGLRRQDHRGRGKTIDNEAIRDYLLSGMMGKDVAATLHCSISSVDKIKRSLGLTKKRKRVDHPQVARQDIPGNHHYDYAAHLEKDFRTIHKLKFPEVPYEQYREQAIRGIAARMNREARG